jgi:hypothetical protein
MSTVEAGDSAGMVWTSNILEIQGNEPVKCVRESSLKISKSIYWSTYFRLGQNLGNLPDAEQKTSTVEKS